METLLNKLEEAQKMRGILRVNQIDCPLTREEIETIISLLKGSNQPSGEGVKSKNWREYWNEAVQAWEGPTSYPRIAFNALTAQARDYEREMEEYMLFMGIMFNKGMEPLGDYLNLSPKEAIAQFRNDRSKPKE